MRNRALLMLALAAALTGCTTYWTKPGMTEATFKKDDYECTRDARWAGFRNEVTAYYDRRAFYNQCMESKGYTSVDKPQNDAPKNNADESPAAKCASKTEPADSVIKNCTDEILSGRLSGANLANSFLYRARAFYIKGDNDQVISDVGEAIRANPQSAQAFAIRGYAWVINGENDKALADFNEAIRLSPQMVNAFFGRADAWLAKGNMDEAIADYDSILRLDPQNGGALFARGRANLVTGRNGPAEKDLAKSFGFKPDSYRALWLYLARARNGQDARQALERDMSAVSSKGWPEPITRFYLGQLDAKELVAAAADANAKEQSAKRCEASFYIGEWNLLQSDREAASASFKQAQATCPKLFIELVNATAELNRLAH